MLSGEAVPNQDKLFSLFETHTQLYKRGKAGQPIQYGRLALAFEDGAGFISHYCMMDRTAFDADVIVAETRKAQKSHRGEITRASFDRGFYSAENKVELASIVGQVSLCPPVNWRLKRYQSLALQTVPVGESEPGLAQVVLFALRFFGRRPGWRFGTV